MPHKRSEMSIALEQSLEASAVHMYVCTLLSRALSRHELGMKEETATQPLAPVSKLHIPPLKGLAELHRGTDDEMLVADREEDEPEDWIVFEGDWNVVSEFHNLTAEHPYPQAAAVEAEPAGCTSSGGSYEKILWSKKRVPGAVKEGVAYVGDKIVGTVGKIGEKMVTLSPAVKGGTWDAVDEAAERYVQQLEELVKLKAAALSSKSKATYQDARVTAEKCSWQLEGSAAIAVDKSRILCQDVESKLTQSGAMDYVQRPAAALFSGAVLVSSKARAVSKAARMKTGELPTYDSIQRGFKSAMMKGFMSAQGRRSASETPVETDLDYISKSGLPLEFYLL